MTGMLDEVIGRITRMAPDEKEALKNAAIQSTANRIWIPQPGPQTRAFYSPADELFYGGQAGGGKTDLILGLTVTDHTDSLVLRRYSKDARKLSERMEGIVGTTEGRKQTPTLEWKVEHRKIEMEGCQLESDKERFKGIPHDLICFDEICDFTKSQYIFIKIWNRSAKDGQKRSRVVCTGNPPTTAEGLWVIEYWAAWLDPRHPNPAKDGELRWYISDENGKDKEVPGPGVYTIPKEHGGEETVTARSRTFIRASLKDNVYLMRTDYGATLDALPKELRAAYRDGRFDLSLKDNIKQVVPTSWIMAAVERWRAHPRPPQDVPMCAMGVDPAAGGDDETVIAPRYDTWWAAFIVEPGKKTPLGSDVAGMIIAKRRDGAIPIIDCGGGYGSGVVQTLTENDIKHVKYKGSEAATGRTKDGLRLLNKRCEAYWRIRELLDPDQPGGSPAMLPDDSMMIADLAVNTFESGPRGIDMTTKEEACELLGRSPDRGDAVVMSWLDGTKVSQIKDGDWSKMKPRNQFKVNMGHEAQRRRR